MIPVLDALVGLRYKKLCVLIKHALVWNRHEVKVPRSVLIRHAKVYFSSHAFVLNQMRVVKLKKKKNTRPLYL
jgi:hypothetical protein